MKCERCGRPAWRSTGGMGGGIMPDDETDCISPGGRACRIATEGRRVGLVEGLEVAKELVAKSPCDAHREPPAYGTIDWSRARCFDCETDLDWSDAEAEIERRCEEER